MGSIRNRQCQDLQVTHSFRLVVESYTCRKLWNGRFHAYFNLPDNLDGNVLAKFHEILPELNTILHKTSFCVCRFFFLAALSSLVCCIISACFANYFFGEDVHEGKTGLGFDYQGSVSQFAPDVDNIVALRQVDPAHYDKDKEKGLGKIFWCCLYGFITFYTWIAWTVDKIYLRKWQLRDYVELWNSLNHSVKLSFSDNFDRALWDHGKTGFLHLHVLDRDGETQPLCSSDD